MANTYFQFKQFTVHQEHCAMKVCTDACLFGAWTGREVQDDNSSGYNSGRGGYMQDSGETGSSRYMQQSGSSSGQREYGDGAADLQNGLKLLDIGAGSGLLSLMMAQRFPHAQIDAVEIDEPAAQQAQENFTRSPWKERLTLLTADIRELTLPKKYDLIISNPPFFENDLKSKDEQRNLALHSEALHLPELMEVASKHLAPRGKFAVLLPFHRREAFEKTAAAHTLSVEKRTQVRQTPGHPPFRSMLLFTLQQPPVAVTDTTLIIKERDRYTPQFKDLLQAYYLHL